MEDLSAPSLNAVPDLTIPCDGSAQVILGPAAGHLIYQRIDGQDTIPIGNIMSDVPPGDYLIRVVDTFNLCSDTTSFTVTKASLGAFTEVTDTITCTDTAVRIYVSTQDVLDSFSWQRGGMLLDTDTSLTVSAPGSYDYFFVTDSGCTQRGTVVVAVDTTSPSLDATTDTLSCMVTTVELRALSQGTGAILWTDEMDNELSSDSLLLTSVVGTYTVTATDSTNGCSTTQDVEVVANLDTPSTPPLPDTLAIECGQPSGLAISPALDPVTYLLISGQDTTLLQDSIIVSRVGVYHVVAINASSGCSSTRSFVVVDRLVGTFEVITDTITCAQQSASIQVITDIAVDSISWTRGGQLVSNDIMPSFDEPGAYDYVVVDDRGCTLSGSITIGIDTSHPDAQLFGQDIGCILAGNVSAVVQGADRAVLTNGQGQELDVSLSHMISMPDTFYLTAINLANGCIDTDTISVQDARRYDDVVATADGVLTCDQRMVQITATTNTATGSYRWFTPAGDMLMGVAHQVDLPGSYIVEFTNEIGCITMDTVELQADMDTLPLDGQVAPIGCIDTAGSVALMVDQARVQSVSWMSAGDFDLVNDYLLSSDQVGTYMVEVVAENGCISRASFDIEERIIMPDLTAVQDPVTYTGLGITTIGVQFNPSNIVSSGWIDTTGLICNTPACNPAVVTDNHLEAYTYQIIDDGGCEATITINVLRDIFVPPLEVYIPNAFSPNNDGINDVFTAYASDPDAVITVFQVFNRWGGRVFSREDVPIGSTALAWDGTSDGELHTPAVFVYRIEIQDSFDRRRTFSGEVHLVR